MSEIKATYESYDERKNFDFKSGLNTVSRRLLFVHQNIGIRYHEKKIINRFQSNFPRNLAAECGHCCSH